MKSDTEACYKIINLQSINGKMRYYKYPYNKISLSWLVSLYETFAIIVVTVKLLYLKTI